jgi:serine/threonine protein kinase
MTTADPARVVGKAAGRTTPGPSVRDTSRPATLLAPAPLPERFGRYRVLKPLGLGGMGSVYLAHDTQLDRRVALKVPHFTADESNELRERFVREARTAATLAHPNLCPVYDVGEVEGRLYLTMPYLAGRPLSQLIAAGKPLPQRAVVSVVRKLALALAEAHARGVVHRDLKPANVMITPRHEPIVMDFGLARQDRPQDARLTQDGAVLGTPAYMSPEQLKGDLDAIGPVSDVYSLGVILYEMLTGMVPFEGSPATMLALILTQPPEPPSQHRRDLDPALEAVCLKAMAKRVEERFATMTEFAAALTDYLRRAGTAAPTPKRGESESRKLLADLVPPQPASALCSAPLPARRLVPWLVAAAALVLLLTAVGLAVLSRPRARPGEATAYQTDSEKAPAIPAVAPWRPTDFYLHPARKGWQLSRRAREWSFIAVRRSRA